MTIAWYIRISREDLDVNEDKQESNSVSNQRNLIDAFCVSNGEFNGCETLEFIDDGYTGTNFERPKFQQMIELARKEKIQCVIIKDFSRLGRDYIEVGNYIEQVFPFLGIRLIAINEGYDSNLVHGTMGGFELAFRNLMHDLYSRDLSKKIGTQKRQLMEKGKFMGGAPVYGYEISPYDKHKLIPEPITMEVVRMIFNYIIQGDSCSAVARKLNDQGIFSPSEYTILKDNRIKYSRKGGKVLWTANAIRNIVYDERYTGKMVSGKRKIIRTDKKHTVSLPKEEWIIVENTHFGIINQEQFDQANKCIKRSKRAEVVTNYSVNLFECPYCGHKLQKKNKCRIIFTCNYSANTNEYLCRNVNADISEVKVAVLEVVKQHLRIQIGTIVKNHDKILGKKMKIVQDIQVWNMQLKKALSIKTQIYEQYADRIITKDEYLLQKNSNLEYLDSVEVTIKELKSKLDILEQSINEELEHQNELKIIERMDAFEPVLLSKVIEKVLVYADAHIEIKWKHREIYANILFNKAEV